MPRGTGARPWRAARTFLSEVKRLLFDSWPLVRSRKAFSVPRVETVDSYATLFVLRSCRGALLRRGKNFEDVRGRRFLDFFPRGTIVTLCGCVRCYMYVCTRSRRDLSLVDFLREPVRGFSSFPMHFSDRRDRDNFELTDVANCLVPRREI